SPRLGRAAIPGAVGGLWGPLEGNANAFQLPDRTVLPQPVSSADLYGTFADDWRISQPASLLDYAAGESTATFTDTAFPPLSISLNDLPQTVLDAAAQATAASGITDPNLLADAKLDYIATGDKTFITGAAAAQQPGGTTTGNVTAVAASSPVLGVIAAPGTVTAGANVPTPVLFDVYLTGSLAADAVVLCQVLAPGQG